MARHDDAAKEWGAIKSWSLFPTVISYERKINSRTLQEERTGSGVRQDGVTVEGGAVISRESQGGGGSGWTVNGADVLVGSPGQVQVPEELRAYVSTHGFWKLGTTAMFNIQIINLDAGSYLHMTPENALTNADK